MISMVIKRFLKKKEVREREMIRGPRSKRHKDGNGKEINRIERQSGGTKKEKYIRFLRLTMMKREYARCTIVFLRRKSHYVTHYHA